MPFPAADVYPESFNSAPDYLVTIRANGFALCMIFGALLELAEVENHQNGDGFTAEDVASFFDEMIVVWEENKVPLE